MRVTEGENEYVYQEGPCVGKIIFPAGAHPSCEQDIPETYHKGILVHPKRDSAGNLYYNLPKETKIGKDVAGDEIRVPLIEEFGTPAEYHQEKLEPVDVSGDPNAVCDNPKVPPFMNFTGLEQVGWICPECDTLRKCKIIEGGKFDGMAIKCACLKHLDSAGAVQEVHKNWKPVYRYKDGYDE
jgi:hypothetical protein